MQFAKVKKYSSLFGNAKNRAAHSKVNHAKQAISKLNQILLGNASFSPAEFPSAFDTESVPSPLLRESIVSKHVAVTDR